MEGRERTNEEIEEAYRIARKIAKRFIIRLGKYNPAHLTEDDYVQEGVIAWLQGTRTVYQAMVHAFLCGSEGTTRYAAIDKRVLESDIQRVEFDESIHGACDSFQDSAADSLDAEKILNMIRAIKDDRAQFIVLGHLYFGLSMIELGEILDITRAWVHQIYSEQIAELRRNLHVS